MSPALVSTAPPPVVEKRERSGPKQPAGPVEAAAGAGVETPPELARVYEVINGFLRAQFEPEPIPGRLTVDELNSGLGFVIRVCRLYVYDITQAEFATALTARIAEAAAAAEQVEKVVNQSTIHRMEDSANPSLPRFASLAAALQMPPSVLVAVAEAAAACAKGGRLAADPLGRCVGVRDLLRAVRTAIEDRPAGAEPTEVFRAWADPSRTQVHARFSRAVGQVLRHYRLSSGMAQAEVVGKFREYPDVKLSEATLSQTETGVTKPSLGRLVMFGSVYGKTLPQVLYDAELRALPVKDDGGAGQAALQAHATSIQNLVEKLMATGRASPRVMERAGGELTAAVESLGRLVAAATAAAATFAAAGDPPAKGGGAKRPAKAAPATAKSAARAADRKSRKTTKP